MNAAPETNENIAQTDENVAQQAPTADQVAVATTPLAPVAKIPNVFTPDLLRGIADHLDNDASRVIVLAKDLMSFKDWLRFIKEVIHNHIPHHKSKETLLAAVSECESNAEESSTSANNDENVVSNTSLDATGASSTITA